MELRCELPQLLVVVPRPPQCQRHYRHVVDGTRLNHGGRSPRRDQRDVRGQLLIEPDERALVVFPYQEADDDHRAARARRRVQVLDARNLPEQLLERTGDALFNLSWRRPGHRHEHVNHRHDDLRFFLAR